jgi:hypothetical protein
LLIRPAFANKFCFYFLLKWKLTLLNFCTIILRLKIKKGGIYEQEGIFIRFDFVCGKFV